MLRSPSKTTGSTPDLRSIETDPNITFRKRKHSEDHSEALNSFFDKMTSMFGNLKADISRENSMINSNLDMLKADLVKLRENSQDLKNEIKCVRKEYSEIKSFVQSLDSKHKELQNEITVIQKSTQFHSERQEDIIKKVESLSTEIQTITNIKEEVVELRKQNHQLIAEINASEQRDRMFNLEIVGVTELKEENVLDLVIKIAKNVGADITPTNIIQANRVSSRNKQPGRPRVIIAKMQSRLVKDNIISCSRKCRLTTKDLGLHGDHKPIYINEHLTVFNKLLLKKCKEVARIKQYQFVWSKHGRIFLRKNDTAPALQISSEEDMKKII